MMLYVSQACIDESSAYGSLSREDILANWLEHTTAQFVFDDQYSTQHADQADSMFEVFDILLHQLPTDLMIVGDWYTSTQ